MNQFVMESPGALLAVRQSRDNGEPLLLLHGGPGVPDSMQTTIAPMLPEFRCISFDQRGVGKSVCRDGRYDLHAYLDDVEAIRKRLAIASWNVLGHSWGGLVAQAYAAAYPQLVKSLVLSSSSLGVGPDWKRTKRESFRTGLARAGFWGRIRFFAYGSGLVVPGPIGSWSMRHVMNETWHNYFLAPGSAPAPDPTWLLGCSAEAMMKTDRDVSKERADAIERVSSYEGPVLVLYGAYDIFGDATEIVRRRFPKGVQVTLEGSGHLHWLQNPSAYASALHQFYGSSLMTSSSG
jgi:proline iminopeptidase